MQTNIPLQHTMDELYYLFENQTANPPEDPSSNPYWHPEDVTVSLDIIFF